MKRILILCCLLFFGCGYAKSSPVSPANGATIRWDPNTEPDLAGYEVHWGKESGKYTSMIDLGDITGWSFTFLPGKYYFGVKAYDETGNRSMFSEEVSYTEIGSGGTLPPVPVDPTVEILWKSTTKDTLTATILVADTADVKSTNLALRLKIKRESLVELDSTQMDLNLVSGGWPVVGTVFYTRNSIGFWTPAGIPSNQPNLDPIIAVKSNTLHAINARLHEKDNDWFPWPAPKKFFKILVKLIGGNIIEESFDVNLILIVE